MGIASQDLKNTPLLTSSTKASQNGYGCNSIAKGYYFTMAHTGTSPETLGTTHYAILQDGDGSHPYPIARSAEETPEDFTNRIADIVVEGIVDYPYTAFCEIIEGKRGTEEVELSNLVVNAMARQRSAELN